MDLFNFIKNKANIIFDDLKEITDDEYTLDSIFSILQTKKLNSKFWIVKTIHQTYIKLIIITYGI